MTTSPITATPFRDASIEPATVALAVSWFDHAALYDEARVVRSSGVIACSTYHLQRVGEKVAAVQRLYSEVLEGCWAPEVRHVEAGFGRA